MEGEVDERVAQVVGHVQKHYFFRENIHGCKESCDVAHEEAGCDGGERFHGNHVTSSLFVGQVG